VVNSIEPAIMAHMKLEKISPNGGSSLMPAIERALFMAADQKNTNRYIIDSKTDEATARASIRLSVYT